MTLPQCIDHCLALSEDGETDWRTPTMDEVSFYRTVLETGAAWNNALTWTSTQVQTNGYYRTAAINELNLSHSGIDTYWEPTYGCRCVR